MSFQVERTNLIGCKALVAALVPDLIAHGFDLKSGGGSAWVPASGIAVLETNAESNPIVDQPWRLRIKAAANDMSIDIHAGTENQLKDDTTVTKINNGANESGIMGVMGSASFFDMTGFTTANDLGAVPLSYQLTVSPRGIALCIWVPGSDTEGNRFSWFVTQRPVDKDSGLVLTSGKAPVFCLYYVNGRAKEMINKFVVREADIFAPTVSVSATTNTEDSRAVINAVNQVAISEDRKYIVQFPNNLNTPRHCYTHDLDMIGITSADVVSQWADVPLRVYGEASDRTYRAMLANGPNNTGMRFLMLTDGGGVA